ncbi:MAG: multiheme c-type cytochrome [Candidatus Eiseniibacteriota bacterium]
MSSIRNAGAGLLALALVLAGCADDEKIVYRDREVFNPPPDAASGFLGYFDPAEKQTTCGNCHADKQSEWEGTAHADAYATLEASGSAQSFCYGCHSVSQNGNPVVDAAGYNVVADAAYHDVQCESCHGPGLDHVENPSASQPLPALGVPASLDNGCVECHSGTHHPFAEEWALSLHATVQTSAAGRAECAGCHRGQAILESWGADAAYLEENSAEHLPITCGVCHDPHEARYASQLRFPVDTIDPELHLCARCHDRRVNPDSTSSRGLTPHAPETSLLLGDAGWFPPGVSIDPGEIVASHGSAGNPKLCATCHVSQFTVVDAATGDFTFHSTGHLFTAVPCVDSQGIPQPGTCGYSTAERSYQACTQCHLSETAAAAALTSRILLLESLTSDLIASLLLVDPNLGSAGGEIDPANPTFTVAEGAYFNYNLAIHGGDVAAASAHNPFLITALLLASSDAVFDTYGVNPNPSMDWERELQQLLADAGR